MVQSFTVSSISTVVLNTYNTVTILYYTILYYTILYYTILVLTENYIAISINVVGSKLKALLKTSSKLLTPHPFDILTFLSSKWLAIVYLHWTNEAYLILMNLLIKKSTES